MKFWQLVSILRESNIFQQLVEQHPRWQKYQQCLKDFDHFVHVQNREVLDQIMEPELCRAALKAYPHRFWVTEDGYLIEHRAENLERVPLDKSLTASEVYERFGGDVLEEVLEKGSVKVLCCS